MEPLGLSIPDAQRALGGSEKPMGRTTIYRMLKRGDLKKMKVGARTLVSVASIKAYADRQLEAA